MKSTLAVLLPLVGAITLMAGSALAVEDQAGILVPKAVTARVAQELQSRAARLGASVGTSDTTWVGHTPGFQNNVNNYWSIYAGSGKDGFKRPVNGQPDKGVWNWDEPIRGDSLQGWWPMRMQATESLPGDTDKNRPHTCLDFGNQANYVINESRGANWQNRANGTEPGWRTSGVDGVWHRDGGILVSTAGVPAPTWTPLGGASSAWMGLRAHGDNTFSDPLTGNPFNEDVLMFNQTNAVRPSGTDKKFPGYGSQMDQMLYRDIPYTTGNLTISFKWRTNLSTGALSASRFGWFNHDPLGVPSTTNQLNNFISGMDAGALSAPRDSFMVYIGSGVDGSIQWRGSNGSLNDVYDKKHRWFSEVLRTDLSFANPANPQPTLYKELLSAAGNNSAMTTTIVIPSAALTAFVFGAGGPDPFRVRLAFRVKTNLFFDDERAGGQSYSSGGAGAAVVDDVTYQINAGMVMSFGDFELTNAINNDPNVRALDAWKSTGKPPAVYHHIEQLTAAGNFSGVLYQDICGQKGDVTRICNLAHGIISQGDHDNGEAAGGDVVGGSERDQRDGIVSPTIRFVDDDGNPNTKNPQGFYGNSNPFANGNGGAGDVDATENYYLHYDIYTGIFEGDNGNFWRLGVMSYPSTVSDAVPAYPAWGQLRIPEAMFFNPIGRQCITDNFGLRHLIRTSNASGIPDSLKIHVQKIQLCYGFSVPSGCSPRDGAYIDNVSLAVVDGVPTVLNLDPWHWIQDAFPANETAGYPGNAALFDTTSAIIKTGLNIAQNTNDLSRYTVPGDSVVISSIQGTARVDMVFRILPGPGNYQPIGDGHNGNLRRVPTSPATITPGDGSYWDVLRTVPGEFATNPAVMTGLKAGWNPNFWVSVRCDTAEANLYAFQGGGVLGGPSDPKTWMATIHESDQRQPMLGITKNRCFIQNPAGVIGWPNIACNGVVPGYLPGGTAGTTKEFTKILPDGILTPGSHVEYFFRGQMDTKTPGLYDGLCPDTNVVFPQIGEGSLDAHRWQEFSILPDRWKDPAYLHPVTQTFGRGPACLLVVDWNDGRGDERAWVSVADTIGATSPSKFGAHNGWHAPGTTNPVPDANDINAPAYRVAVHGGSPGTTWDFYQIKGAETVDAAGTLGSRLSYQGGDPLLANKRARNAPTPEMLDAYYTLMLVMTGDLNRNIIGPFANRSADDAGIITGWLNNGSSLVQDRGIWAIGDGFIEANTLNATELTQLSLALDYFRADLVNRNFQQFANVTDPLVNLRIFPEWKGQTIASMCGVQNRCAWTNDVLTPSTPLLTSITSQYERRGSIQDGYGAGVFKDWDPNFPWKSMVDGWDILNLTSSAGTTTVGRSRYFNQIFQDVWSKIWPVQGTPLIPLPAKRFFFPPAGIDSFDTVLNLTFVLPGLGPGSVTLVAQGPIKVAHSDPYVCPDDNLITVDTEILDGQMEADHPMLGGKVQVLVGTSNGLEPSYGSIKESTAYPDSAESAFLVKPKFVFESHPGTSPLGTCISSPGVPMLTSIGNLPPKCGEALYESGPVVFHFKDCCTDEEVTVLGGLIHAGHEVCADPTPPAHPSKPVHLIQRVKVSGNATRTGTTRLKLVKGTDCTQPLIDTGPVSVAITQSAAVTASSLVSAFNAAIATSCDCGAKVLSPDTIEVMCQFPFATVEPVVLCLQGTDIPQPGRRLGTENNCGQNYLNVIDQQVLHQVKLPDPNHPGCFFTVGVEPPPVPDAKPGEPRLELSPNPFNPNVTVQFRTSRDGPVTLEVYDSQGRLVERILDQWMTAGDHRVPWSRIGSSGAGIAPGLYLVRLRSPDGTKVRKAINLR